MAEKILIVDDDPETIQFLSLVLTRQGYQPLAAKNGMEALSLARSDKPDLIILDVMMPDMDGFEVARNLRRHPDTALIPILMFTAKTMVEDKLAGYESGVDIYLTKPVHPVEMQANIKALLAQRKARKITLAEKGYITGVMSAKGGSGVSTVALNLAISYHKKKNVKVLAAEMRPGYGSWAQELDLPTTNGLTNLLRLAQSEITPAAVAGELTPTPYGVSLLLASNDVKDVELAMELPQFEAIIDQLALLAGLVVLDIGTNFILAYEMITSMCDEMLLVTEPQLNAIKRTRMLMDDLRHKGFGSSKAMTVVSLNHTRAEMTIPVSQLESLLGYSITLGFPPASELAYHAAQRSVPISLVQSDGVIAQQFGALAEHVAQYVTK
ncbi:MAG: response regulator [Anaerolineales bacterium]|nr:response regulator [Anaerolineales bacterium]